MQIWPAIDIRGGNCVRLVQGDYEKETVYGSDPADMALRFVADGATGLHIVDLDGAKQGTNPNQTEIARLVEKVSVPCQLGGGIRSETIIQQYIDIGVDRLVVGTKALNDPKWFVEMCQKYPQRLVVGIDARGGKVSTDGWTQTSDTTAVGLAQQLAKHEIAGIIYTDIAKDGMLAGPNFEAMKEMVDSVPVPVIASGGVTTVEDVSRLATMKLSGCVIGRAIYEGRLTLQEAMQASGTRLAN